MERIPNFYNQKSIGPSFWHLPPIIRDQILAAVFDRGVVPMKGYAVMDPIVSDKVLIHRNVDDPNGPRHTLYWVPRLHTNPDAMKAFISSTLWHFTNELVMVNFCEALKAKGNLHRYILRVALNVYSDSWERRFRFRQRFINRGGQSVFFPNLEALWLRFPIDNMKARNIRVEHMEDLHLRDWKKMMVQLFNVVEVKKVMATGFVDKRIAREIERKLLAPIPRSIRCGVEHKSHEELKGCSDCKI